MLLCCLVPITMNSVLSSFNFNIFFTIHCLTSTKYLWNLLTATSRCPDNSVTSLACIQDVQTTLLSVLHIPRMSALLCYKSCKNPRCPEYSVISLAYTQGVKSTLLLVLHTPKVSRLLLCCMGCMQCIECKLL